MKETKEKIPQIKLDNEGKEALDDLQSRLRKKLGRKPTHPEIALMAFEALNAALDQSALTQARPVTPPSSGGKYPYLEENRLLHDQLEAVLNSGDAMTIRAVVPNIEIFYERLRPVAAATSSKRAG